MSSTSHAVLAQVAGANPDKRDQLRARSALMWLCIATKPLMPHELWLALLVEESGSVDEVERLLSEPRGVDDRRAGASLKGLLGDAILIVRDEDEDEDDGDDRGDKLHVELADELKEALLEDSRHIPDELVFAGRDAHLLAASVSMVIASATTLHLAHIQDRSIPSGLVLYAWTYWSRHLRLSGYTFADANLARVFNSMVYRVCVDALVFLLMMGDFVTGPVEIAARYNSSDYRLQSIAVVRRAQVDLERPIGVVAALMGAREGTAILQAARERIGTSSYAVGGARLMPSAATRNRRGPSRAKLDAIQPPIHEAQSETDDETGSDTEEYDMKWPVLEDPKDLAEISAIRSKVELLRVDRHLRETISFFSKDERQMVLAWTELARGLRLASVSLGSTRIYEGLLHECPGRWSPLDVMYHVAAWAEAIAGYPYWERVPGHWPSTSFLISDRHDENIELSHRVLERIRMIDRSYDPRRGCPHFSHEWSRSPGVSRLRWYATRAVNDTFSYLYLPFGVPFSARNGNFVVNDVRLLRQRTTSFSKLPPQMHNSTGQLAVLRPLLPNSIRRLHQARIRPFFARTLFFQSLDDYSSGAFTAGMSELWPSAKAAILRDGYRCAFAYFGIAILTNHIRRMLVPWLGLYMYYTPLTDLKLAIGSPEVFLDEVLDYSWRYAAFMVVQKTCTEMLGTLAIGVLNKDAENSSQVSQKRQVPPQSLVSHLPGSQPAARLPTPIMDMAKVGYLVWILTNIEYIFARSTSTIAILIAYTKLIFFGTEASHIALGRVLQSHWTKLPLHYWQLTFYIFHGLYPILCGAIVSACAGQAALLLVIVFVTGLTAYVTRYSNKYYMVLELSGLVLVVAAATVAAVVLGREFWRDPLDLRRSTASLRAVAAKARGWLPVGSERRMDILRGREVLAQSEKERDDEKTRKRTRKKN